MHQAGHDEGEEGHGDGGVLIHAERAEREGEGAERRGGDEDRPGDRLGPAGAVEDGLVGITGITVEHVVVTLDQAERGGGEDVRDQVDEEDLQRQQRQGEPTDGRQGDGEDLAEVAAQQVDDEPADVLEDRPALADRRDDGLERVVLQNDVGGVTGHLRALVPHGDADVGGLQGRCVVDAVTGHADDVPT